MSKIVNIIVSIFKSIFHIIYLIGVNIFKVFKDVANGVIAIFKVVSKGLKFIFSVMIPTVFKSIYSECKILIISLINGTLWFLRNIFFVIKKIIVTLANEALLLIRNLMSGIYVSILFIGRKIKTVAVATSDFVVSIAKAIPRFIKKNTISFYNKFLKRIVTEFTDIFRYSAAGLIAIFMGIFYEAPTYLIKNFPIWMKGFTEHSKDRWKLINQWFEDLPKKLKNGVTDKFNNSIFVKNYRNKKLLQFENLTEMQIDKNSADAVRGETKTTFKYLVKNADGKYITGYFSAFSKLDCHSYLLDEGYEVYKIETSKWIEFTHGDRKLFATVMKKKDLIFWLTQLSTYIKSGVPLTDAAKILAAQDKRRKYKKIYDELIYELTMGESFAKALEKQGDVFPALLINMVKAAEMMGDIEDTLDDMANYYTEIESTKKEMKSAMTYPLIISIFAIIVTIFILTYIIPQFEGIYEQADIKMNSLTLMVLNVSRFLQDSWWVILVVIFGVIFMFVFLYKNLKAFKTVTQYVMMHIPVLGKIMIYNEMVLFSKTFSSLQKNNVLLTDSIDILSKITNNEIYKVIMLDTITNLLKGDKMSDSFKDNWAIPELAYYMISTGERTGDLAAMLDKVSRYYQEQQKTMVTTLKAFIEPLMIAGLAIVVGGIIVAAILPMFSMYSQLM